TISTVGVVPGIRALAESGRQVSLAVSLHAANDELRNSLVPLNRRYPIEALVEACESYISATHRRISFEWALIDHVNDRRRDADELASLARQVGAHVNLIPLNPTPLGTAQGLRGSPSFRVVSFRSELIERGVNATVRRTRGREIDAACGQLAAGWVPLQSGTLARDASRSGGGAAGEAVLSGPTVVGPGRLG
ncbi:MAG TPA: 23S rRNA (adenine(2503)-C(2))-methyltransferase RlmN, partial [Acidimicrobiales bacterium]|nr:23S rRNA (adenine(2503)-C(2))-methyltransferase RlmN [Acidimicrobiales bacterium]